MENWNEILKFDEDHIQEIYLESHMNNIFWKPKLQLILLKILP